VTAAGLRVLACGAGPCCWYAPDFPSMAVVRLWHTCGAVGRRCSRQDIQPARRSPYHRFPTKQCTGRWVIGSVAGASLGSGTHSGSSGGRSTAPAALSTFMPWQDPLTESAHTHSRGVRGSGYAALDSLTLGMDGPHIQLDAGTS
jgi:hypothetical protein